MTPAAEILLRRAELADAERIAQLHADSWRLHYRGAYSDEFLDGDVEADRLQVWRGRLAANSGATATVVAEQGGGLVGFVHVVFDDDPEWGSLVDNLHVVAARKRSGIGTKLLRQAASFVTLHGGDAMYLWVLEQNVAAQAFYRARGGSCVGQRLVQPPNGVTGRLSGSPKSLRFAWPDLTVLTSGARPKP